MMHFSIGEFNGFLIIVAKVVINVKNVPDGPIM